MYRKSESPAVTALLGAVFASLVGLVGYIEGAKVRTCPQTLEDGRRLQSFSLTDGTCKYVPPPFRMILSPEEHRRAARAMERMEKVK